MRLIVAAALFALTLSFGCANNPAPTLSPQAKVAFYGTQVIHDLKTLLGPIKDHCDQAIIDDIRRRHLTP